jgi:thiol-disulfide isomerase/thioredoxin
MKKKILYSVLAVLCLNLPLKAQSGQVINALKPGDEIPEIIWQSTSKLAQLSGGEIGVKFGKFRNKLIILDFWATWCGSCLKHFSELHALQEKYKNDVEIILVNSYNSGDSREKIAAALKVQNRQIAGGFKLPCIVGDSVLADAFPHTYLPHMVWIGKDGIVKAITSAEEVTPPNIELLLAKNSLNTYGKADESSNRLLYSKNDLPEKNLLHYCILLKGKIDGLGGGARQRTIEGAVRGMVFSNRTLLTLYNMAAGRLITHYTPKNMLLDVSDSSAFILPKSGISLEDWQRKNLYSLDLIAPPGAFGDFFKMMLDDLNLYSGYTGTIMNKDMGCWILTRINSGESLTTKGGDYNNTLFEDKRQELHNAPVIDLVEWLESLTGPNEAVINQTGYKMIDLSFEKRAGDLQTAKGLLIHHGLQLSYQKRHQDILVIRKNNLNQH